MQFYFALVDPPESDGLAFRQEYARTDWTVLAFVLEHKEGEFASLSLTIKNPGVGLLAGKTWLWFSYRAQGEVDATPLFFGRIVGVPSSILQESVTVELVGRPSDYADQKSVLAQSLRVLPWYDEIFIDERKREDDDAVLEAYTKRWHIDPVTHEVTVSDILVGEDELAEFQTNEMLYDGFDLALAGDIPLRSVTVDAILSWTQLAKGTLDLTNYIVSQWPNESASGVITSFTLRETNWPQAGTQVGENWTVHSATCKSQYDLEVKHRTEGKNLLVKWLDGRTTNLSINVSDDYVETPPNSITVPAIITENTLSVSYQDDDRGGNEVSSRSLTLNFTNGIIALAHLIPTLVVSYNAERPFEERITFTMNADVQPIVTLPGEDEALRIDNIRSVNLSDPIDDTSAAEIPIGNPKRRTYICTSRGEQSLKHLLLLSRAHLLRRARAVEITFAPVLGRLGDISLRKTARIHDSRIPGGHADGKIIAWRFSLDGNAGLPEISATMGCAVGNGGEVSVSEGEPLYVDDDYVSADDDWQEYDGRVVSFNSDIGYEPPAFNPNDDGLDFISGVTVESAIEEALSVENPPSAQRQALEAALEGWRRGHGPLIGATTEQIQDLINERQEAINAALKEVETVATFKLRSMRKEFSSPYPITVADLKVPTMIDLSAES